MKTLMKKKPEPFQSLKTINATKKFLAISFIVVQHDKNAILTLEMNFSRQYSFKFYRERHFVLEIIVRSFRLQLFSSAPQAQSRMNQTSLLLNIDVTYTLFSACVGGNDKQGFVHTDEDVKVYSPLLGFWCIKINEALLNRLLTLLCLIHLFKWLFWQFSLLD